MTPGPQVEYAMRLWAVKHDLLVIPARTQPIIWFAQLLSRPGLHNPFTGEISGAHRESISACSPNDTGKVAHQKRNDEPIKPLTGHPQPRT